MKTAARSQLFQKFSQLNWTIILLIFFISAIGWGLLISAGKGDPHVWALKQMVRFGMGMVILFGIALTDLRWWLRFAYIFYGVSLALLCGVEFMGFIGMGAQRWIDLYLIQLQPSELMKVALILALARYFHSQSQPLSLYKLSAPLLLILIPTVLVLRQPDLGTAMILLMSGGALFFLAGVSLWIFGIALAAGGASIPILWNFLHAYQKKRIFMFLDPSQDSLGAGYHITQSKIALGSGGLLGKGYLQGTQAYLNFVPLKQTDFIFALLCEEWGLLGGTTLILLYTLLITLCSHIALTTQNDFGRYVASGITVTFFLYMFINIAMVMGLLPVVGVPLPLVSYGGTALLTLLMGFGFLLNVGRQQTLKVPRLSIGIL
ncbi:MAG: Bacterial cell division membrane protein [uncultured bacterium]|nr:MAG: Bacterial cell division membrane protein [uncultured bacterium]OFW69959.1 MAG: rod shape-determining protein RodA [Alphaproteobacteria bacterium GWC2_42_16]OFW74438.1 MAG: rod shape-determining protein RodA [Alphaproteobacteria bacterium GWA2_41_27]OFW84791.1 MAG: rod shape-determining protein RodA [Alphaproteobacteria bacterium RIFCSPHIGHO2_12_FULL_42_100]OFW86654.1 MAG: rod shape-determining protein RodA [Alphaproteobacteria bacterium RBG_16_42_14]OFW90666.1 MAG: rod shape-determinin